MFLAWAYILLAGISLVISSSNPAVKTNIGPTGNLILGIILTYSSLNAIFNKLVANEIIK